MVGPWPGRETFLRGVCDVEARSARNTCEILVSLHASQFEVLREVCATHLCFRELFFFL